MYIIRGGPTASFVSEATERISMKSGITVGVKIFLFNVALIQYKPYCHEILISPIFPKTVHRMYKTLSRDKGRSDCYRQIL